jgi:hypothetical protein
MVALPTDFTMFPSAEFAAGTPITVIVLAPGWPGINGDTRNPDGYLGLDWRKYGGACNAECGAGQEQIAHKRLLGILTPLTTGVVGNPSGLLVIHRCEFFTNALASNP